MRELQALFLDTWKKQKCGDFPPRDPYPQATEPGDSIVSIVGSSPDGKLSPMYLTTASPRSPTRSGASSSPPPTSSRTRTPSRRSKAAAARGVDVRLLLPGFTDSWLAFHAGRSHYDDLLAGGVRIFEYHGGLLHAKTLVVDGVWSTIGSSNLDWRSFCYNDEVNAVVVGRAFGSDLDEIFRADLREAREVTRESWAARPASDRFSEWATRKFEELL